MVTRDIPFKNIYRGEDTNDDTQQGTNSSLKINKNEKKKDNAATKGRYVLTVTTTKQQHTKKSSPKAHGN